MRWTDGELTTREWMGENSEKRRGNTGKYFTRVGMGKRTYGEKKNDNCHIIG